MGVFSSEKRWTLPGSLDSGQGTPGISPTPTARTIEDYEPRLPVGALRPTGYRAPGTLYPQTLAALLLGAAPAASVNVLDRTG
jgi:hypothetical protein